MTVLRKVDWPLLMILLIAAVVRYWGISFGFPYTLGRPDEGQTVELAINCLRYIFNPHWFGYPTLYMYINAIVYSIYYKIGSVLGYFSSVNDLVSGYGNFNLHMIDRCLSAFLGVSTVYITYRIAFNLGNRKTGLLAACFLALTYMHVRNSHYGTVDVAVTFFVMCSVYFVLKAYDDSTWRNYLICGIFAGLAAGTKYIGALMIMPVFLNVLFEGLNRLSVKIKAILDPRLFIFGIVTVVVFLLSTPYALLDHSEFYRDVTRQWRQINYLPRDLFGHGWWYHLKFSLFHGLGWPLFLASLAGIFIAFRNDLRRAAVLMAFPAAYYALVLRGGFAYIRYTVPLLPYLCVTAAIFTVFVWELLERHLPRFVSKPIVFALPFLIILPSAVNTVKFDEFISRRDNRVLAAEWMESNVSRHASLSQIGMQYGNVELNPRFQEVAYDSATRKFKSGDQECDVPEYIILQSHPLLDFQLKLTRQNVDGIESILAEKYVKIKSFHALDLNEKGNLYDLLDSYYVPFVGFRGVVRSGPNLDIYKLRE